MDCQYFTIDRRSNVPTILSENIKTIHHLKSAISLLIARYRLIFDLPHGRNCFVNYEPSEFAFKITVERMNAKGVTKCPFANKGSFNEFDIVNYVAKQFKLEYKLHTISGSFYMYSTTGLFAGLYRSVALEMGRETAVYSFGLEYDAHAEKLVKKVAKKLNLEDVDYIILKKQEEQYTKRIAELKYEMKSLSKKKGQLERERSKISVENRNSCEARIHGRSETRKQIMSNFIRNLNEEETIKLMEHFK